MYYEQDFREKLRILNWAPIVYSTAIQGHSVEKYVYKQIIFLYVEIYATFILDAILFYFFILSQWNRMIRLFFFFPPPMEPNDKQMTNFSFSYFFPACINCHSTLFETIKLNGITPISTGMRHFIMFIVDSSMRFIAELNLLQEYHMLANFM